MRQVTQQNDEWNTVSRKPKQTNKQKQPVQQQPQNRPQKTAAIVIGDIKKEFSKINLSSPDALDKINNLCKNEENRMAVMERLIKSITTPEQVDLLRQFIKPEIVKVNLKKKESPFNSLAWRDSTLDSQVFDLIAKALFAKGYIINNTSERDETPLDSLFAWFAVTSTKEFLENKKISYKGKDFHEKRKSAKEVENLTIKLHKSFMFDNIAKWVDLRQYLYDPSGNLFQTLKSYQPTEFMVNTYNARYTSLANLPQNCIANSVQNVCNKISTIHIWQLRHLLACDVDTTLAAIAFCVVNNPVPKSIKEKSKCTGDMIDIVISMFSGSHNCFKDIPCNDQTYATFFKLANKTLPDANKLIDMLVEQIKVCAFDKKSTNYLINIENLGIVLGLIGNFRNDVFVSFVDQCLNYNLDDVEQELCQKMALRAYFHNNSPSPAITNNIMNIKSNNGIIRTVILNLNESKPKTITTSFDINKVTFFNGLLKNPDIAEDSIYKLEMLMKEHDKDVHNQLATRFIIGLLENSNKQTNVESIIREGLKGFDIKTLLNDMNEAIEDLDSPYGIANYNKLLSLFN